MSTDQDQAGRRNMSQRTARIVTWSIVGFCLLALVLIFQPFAIEPRWHL